MSLIVTSKAQPSQRALGARETRILDLMTHPFDSNTAVERADGGFNITRPWGLLRFGRVRLKRGWWVFECEGEGDMGGVELRMTSSENTLTVLSLRRDGAARTLFYTDRVFDIALLLSAWPARMKFRQLRLRRMTAMEEAAFTASMVGRLAKSPKPFSRLVHVAARVLGGRSLAIRSAAAKIEAQTGAASAPRSAVAGSALHRVEASGGVSAVLLCDDQLHPRAFQIVRDAFARSPGLRAVYSDAAENGAIIPKPDWDPELARWTDFVGSPVFFRSGPVEADKPWPMLRAIASQHGPAAIARISLPLVSRSSPQPRTPFSIPAPVLARTPRVSAIIPTKYRIELLESCLRGLAERTDYPDIEVVVVDNGSEHPRFNEVIEAASRQLNLIKVEEHSDFNFSLLANRGVRGSSGEVVLLLNDDIEPLHPGWLHRMVDSAIAPGVGAVGAQLLYPDGSIQHAGVTMGLGGVCGHLWRGMSAADAARIPQINCPGARMAVTGACLAVRRELFDKINGFDVAKFPVALNDIDFCLRLRAAGHRTLYRGDAVLIHHESQSRGADDETLQSRRRLVRETAAFLDRWGSLASEDPFGSPAFDPASDTGAINPSLLAALRSDVQASRA